MCYLALYIDKINTIIFMHLSFIFYQPIVAILGFCLNFVILVSLYLCQEQQCYLEDDHLRQFEHIRWYWMENRQNCVQYTIFEFYSHKINQQKGNRKTKNFIRLLQHLFQNLLISIHNMGNNTCTTSQTYQHQNELTIDQDNANAILEMDYKQQYQKNTLNTKKQSLKQAKCFKQLQVSKSLNFGLDIRRNDLNFVNTKRNIDLNDKLKATKQQNSELEPILFSITNFSIDSYLENSQPKKQNLCSNKRLDKHLSSTCDEQDNLKIMNTVSLDFDLDLLNQQNQINIQKDQFIRVKKQNIQKDYVYREKLGQGSFGEVYKCQNVHTHELRAVKILKKSILLNPKVKQQFLHEFNLLKKVDHPNLIKVFEIYQMTQSMCIVSEFCKGKTLGYYLKKKVGFSLQTKMQILRQIFLGVNYLHHVNIIHRDLKPDNIVFINEMTEQTKPEDVDLRIIDLGLAVEDGKAFKDWANIGTYNFMAPEVFNGFYSNKCDSWACGLIAYLLLLGLSPFKGFDLQEVKKNINQYSPNSIDFKGLKQQAIDLLLNLTKVNYVLRWTIKQALKSKFFARQQKNQHKNTILKKLSNYYGRNLLVIAAQSYLSLQKTKQIQHHQLSKFFHQINSSQNGLITLKQLQSYFSHLPTQKVEHIFIKLDKNHSGNIDFGEFLAAMVNRNDLFSQNNIKEVFNFIDIDRNGQISKQQLKHFLQTLDKNLVGELIQDMSQNNKKVVTFQQFSYYFRSVR